MFVTNANGCKDSTSKTITVSAKPKASFTTPNAGGCSNGNGFSFTNTSTNATSYIWDFGDGTGATTTNATHSYASIGTYTVKLIALNASGCGDTATQTFTMIPKPTASFNVSSLGGCINNSFSFSDNSSVTGAASYYYDFGDGVISLLQNPTHTYSNAGAYRVIFFVTNANGCKDSTSRAINVVAKPKAAFSLNNYNPCSNNYTITTVNSSTGATNYFWDFGDGILTNQQNITKTFAGAGTYTITLIATNGSGCSDTARQTISYNGLPNAQFTFNSQTQCTNNNLIFFATFNKFAAYAWDFGDGTTGIGLNPAKTYTSVGTYIVKLVTTNLITGCTATTSQTITVSAKPAASFTLTNYNLCSNNYSITTANSSTGATSYVWNFGDGNGATLTNATHTYAVQGTYRITLIATNANGCLDSTSQTITLSSKPTAAFSVSSTSQCLTSNSFSFANGSTGNISGFVWNFGDGTNSTALNPTKTYTAAGTYTVTLTVTNANGCTDVATQVINVTGKPVISYNINNATQCFIGNVFTFTNTSPNQSGITYYWSFGDGILSSLNTISKVYTSTGTFRVTLIATNGNGCIDSLVKTVSVLAKPTPSFTVSSNVQCVNNGFVFTNTTSTTNASYTWRFGDGTISNSTNASHSYATSGSYIVTLIASNSGGCVDSVSQTIFVTAKPVASFTIATSNQCAAGTVVNFNNSTTGSFSSLIWLFSDGTISTDISPVKTFATAGTYTAKLLVLSNGGCRDSSTQSFTILPKTVASFALSNITQCINNSFTFTSTSTAGLNSLTYKWDLGDGTLASTSTVTKSYLLAGTYNVKLLVVNNTTGCRDSVIAAVTVNPQPTANLVGSGTICSGNSFIINVNLFGTPPYSFTYNDGTTNHFVSGINTAVYGLGVSPTTTTTYRIVAMNDANCSASVADVALTSSTVTVNQAAITQQPINTVACIGNTATLSGLATANTAFTYQWQKNGVDILGETSSTLTITNANVLQSGNYRLAIVLPCGRIYSNVAVLTVPNAPAPPAFPATVALCQFDTAQPLTASGTILRWYTTATGGIASPVPPTPNTLVTGTQQYWVSNSTTDNCESARYLITVTVRPAPAVTAVALGSTVILPTQTVVLRATPSLNTLGVRWYYNGVNIGSTINNEITVDFNHLGKYQAEAVTTLGCIARSQIIEVTAPGGIASMSEGNNLRLYPNPATSVVNMYFDNPVNENVMVRLVNAWGQVLQTKAVKFTNRFQPITLKVSDLRADIYAVEILNSKGLTIARNLFVKAQ